MKELEIRLNCLADKAPSEREEIGNGQIDINLNVKNVTITDQDGKTRCAVSFDSYRVKSSSVTIHEIVNALIRAKYSESEEFSVLRQKDTKSTEYASYNAFCESCKALGKTIYSKLNE